MPRLHTSSGLPMVARLSHEATSASAVRVAVPIVAAGVVAAGCWLWAKRFRRPDRLRAGWLDRLTRDVEIDAGGHEVLKFVRDSLVGLNRSAVRSLLGVPSAAGDGKLIVSRPPPERQQSAPRWYYRLDRLARHPARERGTAIVVAFDDDDRATDARFLATPWSG